MRVGVAFVVSLCRIDFAVLIVALVACLVQAAVADTRVSRHGGLGAVVDGKTLKRGAKQSFSMAFNGGFLIGSCVRAWWVLSLCSFPPRLLRY